MGDLCVIIMFIIITIIIVCNIIALGDVETERATCGRVRFVDFVPLSIFFLLSSCRKVDGS